MQSPWVVLAAVALGALMGAAFSSFVYLAFRRSERVANVASPKVPDGVDQILDALESAGIVLDPSANVVKASPGAVAMGLVRGGVLVHEEIDRLAVSVRSTGERAVVELDLGRGRFGESNAMVRVRAARLGTRFILVLAEDITESKRLDEVRRDFIANISHELKTPIGAVGLLAEALQTAADDPEQVRRFATKMTAEAARLAKITAEIIELSRLQAADALARPELIHVDHIVAAAIDQSRVVAESAGVELVGAGGKGLAVFGDEALLTVAVHNLVTNAIAYSSPGGRVGVGARATDGAVEIAVTDQGIGIADEDKERVFERFFRVDDARSRRTGGTGLGLSIVKHTVQNHGGEVKVWSQLGRGSTFTIRLPQAAQEPTSSSGRSKRKVSR
ncbi:sensor histidine kinase [Labedella endophytica]|uniref:Sensor-like histidine kinase SenX3 n=1 Tax=Labedella endophytica TaxID=1523160 RepID=A0A3S0V9A5_9MICO|nr:ATP-binding protein [Labedella endophytica]RUQ99013.1 two-component sensor histidine kinase [Labedella endophytica]